MTRWSGFEGDECSCEGTPPWGGHRHGSPLPHGHAPDCPAPMNRPFRSMLVFGAAHEPGKVLTVADVEHDRPVPVWLSSLRARAFAQTDQARRGLPALSFARNPVLQLGPRTWCMRGTFRSELKRKLAAVRAELVGWRF